MKGMRTERIRTLLGLAATLLLLASSAFSQSPQSLVGKKFPKFEVAGWMNSGGKPLALNKLKGKVVVLDFWAFW